MLDVRPLPGWCQIAAIEHGQGNRSCAAGISFDKRQAQPLEATASCALQPMHGHLQQSLLTADRRHAKSENSLPLGMAVLMPAGLTNNMVVGRFNREDKSIAENLGTATRDALDTKGMIQK